MERPWGFTLVPRGRIGLERLATILTALVSVAALSAEARAQASPDSAALRDYVDAYRSAWNTHDANALAAFYAEDADLLMGDLPAARGRRAIRDWWAGYFARQEPGRRLAIEVTSERLLSPHVALLDVATTTGGRDGEDKPLLARKARGTWLLRRHEGEWLIEALRGLPTQRDSVELVATAEAAEALRPDIRAFVRAYEDAFNGHDPAAVAALYTDEADIVVRNSPEVRGRTAILDWWRAYFSEPRPSALDRDSWYESMRAILVVDEIRMMAPDVALLEVTATAAARQPDARPLPVRYARATWVVVREDEGWRIAALRVLPSEDDRVIRRTSPTVDPGTFAREWLEAWNSRDVDRILTFYAEDALYEDVPVVTNGWGEALRGHAMIREGLAEGFEAMPDLSFELVSASGVGFRMAVEWVMTGTHEGDYPGLPATGRSVSIRGITLLELERGKIASSRDYYDAYLFLTQLGAVPALNPDGARESAASKRIASLIRGVFGDVWSRGDLLAVDELFAPDFTGHTSPSERYGVGKGCAPPSPHTAAPFRTGRRRSRRRSSMATGSRSDSRRGAPIPVRSSAVRRPGTAWSSPRSSSSG